MHRKKLIAMFSAFNSLRAGIARGLNNGHSKYMPHQGAAECERRRKKMLTGEFKWNSVNNPEREAVEANA